MTVAVLLWGCGSRSAVQYLATPHAAKCNRTKNRATAAKVKKGHRTRFILFLGAEAAGSTGTAMEGAVDFRRASPQGPTYSITYYCTRTGLTGTGTRKSASAASGPGWPDQNVILLLVVLRRLRPSGMLFLVPLPGAK